MSTPYADEAFAYFRAGWRGVIPLPPMAKSPPPSGFTGWTGVETTSQQIAAWITDRQGSGNIGLHLGDGSYGLDVDAYDGKDGAAALAELVARCGELPPTWTSTSRDGFVSGIRMFRAALPPGRVWLNEPGGGGRGIESIHRGHRYAVVSPSVHPKTGAKYRWLMPDGQPAERVPSVDELPWLPEVWVMALSKPGEIRTGAAAGHDESVAAVNAWRVGKSCHCVAVALSRALSGMERPDVEALHPAASDSIWNLIGYGNEGHVGVREALGAHLDRFIAARAEAGRSGAGEAEARDEWWRMLRLGIGKLDVAKRRAECICVLPAATGVVPPVGFTEGVPATPSAPAPRAGGRRVDLAPYLDGTFEAPEPEVGAQRDDMRPMLYAGKWHTLIAPNEAGKSLWAAWHIMAELHAGHTVVYAHFEESSPAGTIGRLLVMGVPKEAIRDRFIWYDCSSHWQAGEFAAELASLAGPFAANIKADGRPTLLVLDGINEACGQHKWPVNDVDGVTAYKVMFVTPAMSAGMAVLSLGHPPKARGREDERHGFGSTAWLDLVDGVGFRLVPSKDKPIGLDRAGMVALYSVKDRYGSVAKQGLRRETDPDGWVYQGMFIVDSTGSGTKMRVSVPREDDAAEGPDPVDKLAEDIVTVLRGENDYSYPGVRALESMLRAAKVKFDKGLTADAIHRLRSAGRLELVQQGQRLGGRLTDVGAQDTEPSN